MDRDNLERDFRPFPNMFKSQKEYDKAKNLIEEDEEETASIPHPTYVYPEGY